MSERGGAEEGPPLTLGAGLRRWFLRPSRPHGEVIEDRTVSFLELFYDLVFVVLVGQLAHTLADDVSWSGALDFAVVFGLIWIARFNGAQFHELHGREDGRHRSFISARTSSRAAPTTTPFWPRTADMTAVAAGRARTEAVSTNRTRLDR